MIYRSHPNKIKDLLVFPRFTHDADKAVDKGNLKPLEKPGEKRGANRPVGKNAFHAQPATSQRTAAARLTDSFPER
ncbi:hypothetical protein [Aquipseudomonas alcaligenes]|uniref:hypothetical protein n=1 Tax=Aquipseudomonas alcaligenes TaxID=43263 RepID=UPI001659AA1F|nr:hypothetical protein [Pseudomonas alcaligenes]